jgi:hypothetical protein
MIKGEEIKTELQESEYTNQVAIARGILNEFYSDSRPLLMLGYNGEQISALHSVYSAVEEGNAVNAQRNLNYPVWIHTARFENSFGSLGIDFSGNGDFQVSGSLKEEVRKSKNFPIGTHPQLFLLYKRDGQDNDLKSISERIFRGKYSNKSNVLKDTLAKINGIKEYPSVKYSFRAQWLDEETKMDAVFHFPATNEYHVFRKVKKSDNYETWGRRYNISSEQIEEVLIKEQNPKILTFEKVPSS